MNNDKRNDEQAQDQDAEMKRLLAKLGIHSDENVYLSIESMEAITAAVTDEEKRQLIARSLQFRNPPQSRSYFIKDSTPTDVPGDGLHLSSERIEAIAATDADEEKRQLASRLLQMQRYANSFSALRYLTHKPLPGNNVLNPLDQFGTPVPNFAQQPAHATDDDKTSERGSGMLKFGLMNAVEIYVEYYEHAFSDSLRIEWMPVNGGGQPFLSVTGAGLTVLARHSALLQVFEQCSNPTMEEVLSWFSNFGTRHDLD